MLLTFVSFSVSAQYVDVSSVAATPCVQLVQTPVPLRVVMWWLLLRTLSRSFHQFVFCLMTGLPTDEPQHQSHQINYRYSRISPYLRHYALNLHYKCDALPHHRHKLTSQCDVVASQTCSVRECPVPDQFEKVHFDSYYYYYENDNDFAILVHNSCCLCCGFCQDNALCHHPQTMD